MFDIGADGFRARATGERVLDMGLRIDSLGALGPCALLRGPTRLVRPGVDDAREVTIDRDAGLKVPGLFKWIDDDWGCE